MSRWRRSDPADPPGEVAERTGSRRPWIVGLMLVGLVGAGAVVWGLVPREDRGLVPASREVRSGPVGGPSLPVSESRPAPPRPLAAAPCAPGRLSDGSPRAETDPLSRLTSISVQVAVRDREVKLSQLEALDRKYAAEQAEAEAKIAESRARISALRVTPPPPQIPPIVIPPGEGGPAQVAAALRLLPPPPVLAPPAAAPSQAAAPPAAPLEPVVEVRLIDASGPYPEALVSLGTRTQWVRAGSRIGDWQVAAVEPEGLWLRNHAAERVWRPLVSALAPARSATPNPNPADAREERKP